ncbi:MAG: hypothetical protein KAS12_00260 [Candidatus Aenigmarchaeota archaeon]|nr:hypothetical protein [Candidatus Aenigmarchaeota archaeon]
MQLIKILFVASLAFTSGLFVSSQINSQKTDTNNIFDTSRQSFAPELIINGAENGLNSYLLPGDVEKKYSRIIIRSPKDWRLFVLLKDQKIISQNWPKIILTCYPLGSFTNTIWVDNPKVLVPDLPIAVARGNATDSLGIVLGLEYEIKANDHRVFDELISDLEFQLVQND